MKPLLLLLASAAFATAALAEVPPDHPGMGGGAMGAPQGTEAALTEQGKVVSVIDTKGFTYIEVQQPAAKLWVAVPTTAVKAGDTIRFPQSARMASYHSQSLDRTFYNVIFAAKVVVEHGQ